MDVVLRALMAAGMGVYGTLHAMEAVDAARGDGPGWIVVAFGLAALAAYGLLLALVLGPRRAAPALEHAAAAMALVSAVALTLVLTVGFLGLGDDLRVESVFAYVAEGVVLLSWVLLQRADDEVLEQDERTARELV